MLKHAHATRIRVATAVGQDRVSIDISDNGHGFSATGATQGGRGLNNMRNRARTIGGDLENKASATGTTLSLLLPVN